MSKPKKEKETFKVTAYEKDTIDKHILDVASKATSLKVKIHSLAISILSVVARGKKGDVDNIKWMCEKLNALQQASPYHAKAFSKWVEEFTNLHWSKENKEWYVHVKEDNHIGGVILKKAKAVPFWELSPPPAPQPMVLSELLEKLIKRAEKRHDEPVDGDDIPLEAMKHLREALKAAEGVAVQSRDKQEDNTDF